MLEIHERQVPTGSWGGKETRPKLQVRERLHPEERARTKGKGQTKAKARANNKTHLPKARTRETVREKANKQSKDQAFIR